MCIESINLAQLLLQRFKQFLSAAVPNTQFDFMVDKNEKKK